MCCDKFERVFDVGVSLRTVLELGALEGRHRDFVTGRITYPNGEHAIIYDVDRHTQTNLHVADKPHA